MKIIALVLLLLVFIAGCTDHDATKETLEKAGYTEITTGGYDVFGCGKDDFFSTKFEATNPAGQKVSGTVCCGIFKKCTVRF